MDAVDDPFDTLHMIPLDHERDGVTPQRCIRQGAESVETDYFLHIDSDIVLTPGSLEKNLALVEPDIVVHGITHDVAANPELSSYPNIPILRKDWRLDEDRYPLYLKFRDSYWIRNTESYFAVGGHDIRFPGYGMVDYDLACRWMMRYGTDSYILGPGDAFHLGGMVRPTYGEDPENLRLFTITRQRFEEALSAGSITT